LHRGTVYILADFENPSFPPAGWTVQNTTVMMSAEQLTAAVMALVLQVLLLIFMITYPVISI
jgi:hypothetical protein